MVSGVPGSGKTTFSERLKYFYMKHAKQYQKEAFHLISSDELREEITGNRKDLSKDELVWERFYSLPLEYIEKFKDITITVLDATHVSSKKRISVAEQYSALYDEIIIVQFAFDKKNIFEINRIRKHSIPEEVLKGFCDSFEFFTDEERQNYDCYTTSKNRYTEDFMREILGL